MHAHPPPSATALPKLRAQIDSLLHVLPEVEFSPRESGEVDFYGASDVIARHLGLPHAPFTRPGPTWIHGWSGAVRTDLIRRPESMSDRLRKEHPCLVDHPRLEGILREQGYTQARAIGAPLVYADAGEVKRIPGSVLVMPIHSSRYATFDGRDKRLPYVEECLQLRGRFEVMAGCIGAEDAKMGNWIHAFEVNDLPWVSGAWSFDRNALVRMQRILRSFEYVCTNAKGSHVAYAAYCGCKVFFFGENRELPTEVLLKHPHLVKNPALAEESRRNRAEEERRFRADFPFFFVPPEQATRQVEWGREQLGDHLKLPPQEVAALLGWKLERKAKRFFVSDPLELTGVIELMTRAQQEFKAKRHAQALVLLDVILARGNALRNAHLLRGLSLCHLGRTDEAREAIAAELALCPDNAEARAALEKLDAPASVAAAPDAAPAAPHPFTNPAFEVNNIDLYWGRSSILRAVQQAVPHLHGTFLDIGCGIMPYRELITKAPSRVTRYIGMDIETPIYKATVDLRWDGSRIPLEDASVDSAMATEVLEHCPDPLVVLKEARRVLKPGGVFFFTVPYIWPLHDAPYDFFRYTPFALEKLLADAGFGDIEVQALGGWNASLAQMIGLWLKRSPMTGEARSKMARQLWPLYQELVKTDELPADPKAGNTMATGWTGIARVPAAIATTDERPGANSCPPEVERIDLPLVLVRSHEFNYSETFLEDHVNHLTNNLTLLYGYPFPRFVKGGRSVLPDALEQKIKTASASGGQASPELWQEYSAAVASFLKSSGARVALVETGLMGAFVHEACEQAALPYVVHFHGMDAFAHELLARWRERYTNFFRTGERFVAVSKAMQAQLIKLGAPADRAVLAPYGVSTALPHRADPANAGPQFIAVGRFVEKKAPHLTLQAFAAVHRLVPAAKLVMIGDGPLLRPCQEWVAKNGLANAVTFAGVQSREEVSRRMAASAVFVQHSVTAANGDSEGLPLAVLEAGAHGLAVVSTLHAGIPDAVRDRVDGFLVAEKDIKGMAAAMLRLARDPALAAQFGASFRQRVEEEYSRKRSIRRLQDLLQAAADGTSRQNEAPAESAPAESVVHPLAAIGLDRNNCAAYVDLGAELLDQGALAEAYCAIGEAHRLTNGMPETAAALKQLEDRGVLEHERVASYRQRAGWTNRPAASRPRRILIVTNLLPPQEMGGYGRTMWEFGRELTARGHNVRVLTSDMPHLLRKPTDEHAAFEPRVRRTLRLIGDWKNGVAVVEPDVACRRETLAANHQTILKAVKEVRPDIVIAGNLDFVGHHFLQPVLDAGIPVLHRLGNAGPGYDAKQTPKSPLYCLAGCSEWVNENLRAKGFGIERFAVLPPGSPLTEYFRAFPPGREKLRIAFASLLMPYKGAHVLVEALARLHRGKVDFECTLAGDSTAPDFVEKLKAFAAQRGFADRLSFPGFLAKQELAALYARSNVLVFPSVFEEPFGKTQIEAMAAGLLVISSGTGGSREIVRDGETGLIFKSGDAADLALKLATAQANPAAADTIAAAGQADAFRFSTRASVERLESICEELIGDAARRVAA